LTTVTTTTAFYPSFVTFKSSSISKSQCDSLDDKQMEPITLQLGNTIKEVLGMSEKLAGFSQAQARCGSIIVRTPLDIAIVGRLLNLLRGAPVPVFALSRSLSFAMAIEGSVFELIDPSATSLQCEQDAQKPSFAQHLLRTIAASIVSAIGKTVSGFDVEREITELGQVVCKPNVSLLLKVHQAIKKALEQHLADDSQKIRGVSANRLYSFVSVSRFMALSTTTALKKFGGVNDLVITTVSEYGNNDDSRSMAVVEAVRTNNISLIIAVVVCVAIILLVVLVAIVAAFCYINRIKVGDHKVTPRHARAKVGITAQNLEDGIARVQVGPSLEATKEPENRYGFLAAARPGTQKNSSASAQTIDAFPSGIPNALRLKMSRRRRTNQRRKRKSRAVKKLSKVLAAATVRKVILDRRKNKSYSTAQPFSVVVAPVKPSTTADMSTVRNVRIGPRSRARMQNSDTPTSTTDGHHESRLFKPSRSKVQTDRHTGHESDSQGEQAGGAARHVGVV